MIMERSYTPYNQLKVLSSPGYGAGWSTWAGNINLALDARIIEYYEKYHDTASEKDVAAFLTSIGYPHVYCGGWKNLEMTTIPRGEQFRINEDDGNESIEINFPETWITA